MPNTEVTRLFLMNKTLPFKLKKKKNSNVQSSHCTTVFTGGLQKVSAVISFPEYFLHYLTFLGAQTAVRFVHQKKRAQRF